MYIPFYRWASGSEKLVTLQSMDGEPSGRAGIQPLLCLVPKLMHMRQVARRAALYLYLQLEMCHTTVGIW